MTSHCIGEFFLGEIDRAAALIGERQHQHKISRTRLIVEGLTQIADCSVELALLEANGGAKFEPAVLRASLFRMSDTRASAASVCFWARYISARLICAVRTWSGELASLMSFLSNATASGNLPW